MSVTCYITFGQRYWYTRHPVDERASPDGWFEYVADDYVQALRSAQLHLMGDGGFGNRIPLYAFHYDEHDLQRGYYPRGCLARFDVNPDGSVREVSL